MENIRDWCISRQIWWGHQIPAYYHNETGEMVVAKENPDPANYTQDSDVLDTWFSSGLWPFSTMGWPNTDSADFKKFYPTSILVTGFDIIFFWVARMITMGYEFTKKAPFSTVFIHGLIRDEFGQKMSKSKGNTIDPVQIIDKYGCDALRFTLTSLCTYGGQDIKVSDERFEYGRNFSNKIWNGSRFVLMNLEGVDDKPFDVTKLTLADKWILNELNNVAKEINEDIKTYHMGEYAHTVYDFFWGAYCDRYVELAKIQLQNPEQKLNTQRILLYVLDNTLRLLHPVMPHITESIWQLLPSKKDTIALMKAKFPTWSENFVFEKEAQQMNFALEVIKSLRNIRQSFGIALSAQVDIKIAANKDEKEIFEAIESYLTKMAKVREIEFVDEKFSMKQSASAVVGNSKIIVNLAGLIDLDEEIKRQNKKLEKLNNERNTLQAKLNNKKFVDNAPAALVEQTRARIEEINAQTKIIDELIGSLV